MNKWNKNIPDGTRDILFDEARLYNDIENKFAQVFEREGFDRIMTPSIEYYDVFDDETQAIEQEAMYKLTDSNGRLIVLRADNTMPAARVCATKLRSAPLPLKLFYNQNIYRINSDFSGKRSEIPQSGVEIIGATGLKGDLICIMAAIDALSALGIDYKLEIGNVGYFNSIIAEMKLDTDQTRRIRSYVDAKNSVSLGLMKNVDLDKIRRIPLLYGDIGVLDEAGALAQDNAGALDAINYVRTLYSALSDAGYADNVIIDMGMVHRIDYYTGTVIAGYISGAGEPVLKGGRYDKLIAHFGYDVPATGFAINVALVADAIAKHEKCAEKNASASYIIHFNAELFACAERYKRSVAARGGVAEYSCFDELADSIDYAKRKCADYVAVIENAGEIRIIEVEKQ